MKKDVLIFVGGSTGIWLGNCIYKKFIKPKFDEQNKKYECKIEQATNELIKEQLRHEKTMEEIDRGYVEWKKEHDEQFAKEMEELEAKCEEYRKRIKAYGSLVS